MNSLNLSSRSDEELDNLNLESKTFGVIGVCGIVGNLVARILMEKGCTVIGTDMSSKKSCRFESSFEGYDIEIFYGGHPVEFFKKADYIIPPPSLPKTAKIFDLIDEFNIPILELGDIFKLFSPDKPVICIGGTNGKTTTTTLLKHIAYSAGIKPSEHNLKGMQGNNEFIPSLQTRLNGDVAILETGTDGTPGGLESIINLTHANFAILTNITIDHLNEAQNFLDYATVKGELVKGIEENNGTLIYNSDDPTVVGLLDKTNYSGDAINFGLDVKPTSKGYKECWCGKTIEINEIISGSGTYECDCGIKYEKPMYLAKNISLEDKEFTLESPEGEKRFKLTIDGLHNIYNAVGAIIAARKFLKLSDDEIQKGLSTFSGVAGRMDFVGKINGKDIVVDYAHNPAGVQTVLNEITKLYGDTTVVITVSSESGESGDTEILDCAMGSVKYIVPASYCSRIVADKKLEENAQLMDKFIFTEKVPEDYGKATLGASSKQVVEGVKAAIDSDVNIILVIGEAAFKFSSDIKALCDG